MRRREKSVFLLLPLSHVELLGSDCLSHVSKSPGRPAMVPVSLGGDPRLRVRITPPAPLSSPTSGLLELVYTGSREQAVKYLGILQAGG